MAPHRIRTICKAAEKFPTPTALYEAMLKITPELKGKLKIHNLFAPKEFVIKAAPDLVATIITTLENVDVTSVHLEGDALLVRNVPTEISPEKVQVLLQQNLQPQIVFVDMFRPTQQGALHRGTGKLYLAREAWSGDAFQAFRDLITPTEISDPFIRIHHVDPYTHLGPMYVYKWKHLPRQSASSPARKAQPLQSAPAAPWANRPASLSPDLTSLTNQFAELERRSMAQLESLADRTQELHKQVLSRVNHIESAVESVKAEVQTVSQKLDTLNGVMAQIGKILGQQLTVSDVICANVTAQTELLQIEKLKRAPKIDHKKIEAINETLHQTLADTTDRSSGCKRQRSEETCPRKAPAPTKATPTASRPQRSPSPEITPKKQIWDQTPESLTKQFATLNTSKSMERSALAFENLK